MNHRVSLRLGFGNQAAALFAAMPAAIAICGVPDRHAGSGESSGVLDLESSPQKASAAGLQPLCRHANSGEDGSPFYSWKPRQFAR